MNLYSLNTVAIALIAIGLIIPTGAVMHGDGGDRVWEDQGIVLTPHDSPNGQAYAEIGPDGNLTIDLATVGVNPNALTTIRNLFDIGNLGPAPLAVWITHNGTESARFSVAEHGSIQGESNNLTIGAGDRRTVDLLVNTRGMAAAEEPLLSEFDVHVKPVVVDEPSDGGQTGGDGADEDDAPAKPPDSNQTATPTPEPTETPTAPSGEGEEDVEVIFEEPTDGPVEIREIPVEEVLRGETDEDDQRAPRAVISHAHGAGSECPCADRPEVQAGDLNAIVEENEEVTLSAARSVLGSIRSVDPQRRLVKAVDIDVPAGREDSSATIRMRVNEARFEGTELSRPRIGHETDDGWQMLPTRIVGQEGGQLILEATTPGFSRFAVFATPEVRYVWQLDDDTVTAEELRTRFDEPGYHNVSLSVTDAFGRTSNATYRVLVNDRPSVSIDVPANRTAGEPLTLRANVTNEIGNATVTWLFPDGSQQEGLVVQHAFERGDQPVRVTVEDEYGATSTVERTITIGPVSAAELVIDRIAAGMPFELALGIVGLLSFIIAILLRRGLMRGGLRLPPPSISLPRIPSIGQIGLRSSEPRILAFENPTVDVANRRFRIGHLRIEDPDGDLRTVEMVVTDSRGNEVAQKTVDLRGRAHFSSRNETILPKSKVYVRPDDDYTIRIRAGDSSDGWTQRSHGSIRAPGSVGA